MPYSFKGGKEVVCLDDGIVVNEPLFLRGFDTYKVSFTEKGRGLDYHGVTIIPTGSLPGFIANMEKAMKKAKNEEFRAQLSALIRFCDRAQKENMYIIHFGL